jgi:hypothetical protein
MAIAANKNSIVDLRLPLSPSITKDPAVQQELAIVYTALRSLQASMPNYKGMLTTTQAASLYTPGSLYFDTTLNKLRIGGATAWETITST